MVFFIITPKHFFVLETPTTVNNEIKYICTMKIITYCSFSFQITYICELWGYVARVMPVALWIKNTDRDDIFGHVCNASQNLVSYDDIHYKLTTNLMQWLLFIHKILFSSTCVEPQVLIFRRIQLYTCSLWCCHCLWEFLVACRYTAWVRVSTHSNCVPTGYQELS